MGEDPTEEDLEGELDAIAEEDLQLGPAPLFHWECFHSHGGTPIAGCFGIVYGKSAMDDLELSPF